MKVNRNINKYIKDCKLFFPFLSKNEKKFLKRLKMNIIENKKVYYYIFIFFSLYLYWFR